MFLFAHFIEFVDLILCMKRAYIFFGAMLPIDGKLSSVVLLARYWNRDARSSWSHLPFIYDSAKPKSYPVTMSQKKDQLLTAKVCAAVEFWGRKGIICPSGVTMSMPSFSNCLPKIFDNAIPNNLGISFMRFILATE